MKVRRCESIKVEGFVNVNVNVNVDVNVSVES